MSGNNVNNTGGSQPVSNTGQTNQQAQQPTVTNNKGPQIMQNAKNKIALIIQKFVNWISNSLGQFAEMFNKNHKMELAYITKNEKLHADISANIQSGKFRPQINSFPMYKVPYQKLTTGIKFDETCKKYEENEKLNIADAEYEMYPTDIVQNMKAAKSEEEKIKIMSNYILYGKPTPGQLFNSTLTQQLWKDILDNLTGAPKIINDFCKAHKDESKRVAQVLQSKARNANVQAASSDNEKQQEGQKTQTRIEQLFNVFQTVSRIYTVTTMNCIQTNFYKTNYKTYTGIITAFNQQKNQMNFNTQTTQPAQPSQPNTPPSRSI